MAYSPEKKAEVCADLLNGLSCDKAAKKHGVGKATVIAWRQELENEGILNASAKKKPTDQNRPKTDQEQEPTKIINRPGSEEDRGPIRVLDRRERFLMKLEEIAFASLEMELAIARVCSDAGFIKNNPVGVNVLAESIRGRVDTLVSTIGRGDPTAKPSD